MTTVNDNQSIQPLIYQNHSPAPETQTDQSQDSSDSSTKFQQENHTPAQTGRSTFVLPLIFYAVACAQEEIYKSDVDGDGFSVYENDCDDGNENVHPRAIESCDGIDNNCDGIIDPNDAEDAKVWYADKDGDNFGNPTTETGPSCKAPEGFVANWDDCDDKNSNTNPSATEDFTNGIDDDCDSVIDDQDLDGVTIEAGDLNDTDPNIYPGSEKKK